MKLLKIASLLTTLVPAIVGASPIISSISPILSQANQSIVIEGSGFGTLSPYNGNSDYILITDRTANWSAGYLPAQDVVKLNVTSWTDTQITLSGFIGSYGNNGWVLTDGDTVSVKVWNAQTKTVAAVCSRIVNDTQTMSCLPVKGTVTWAKPPYKVQCQNNTTNQKVIVTRKNANYGCEKSGLLVNQGDSVTVSITGIKY
ncbi:hypothetical protein [Methylovulum sp.]|uniref:hypothetical protein n=1 Tax=Methylovulum sp. TaxID=1916980 RepID=UPI002619E661|nr:hypothetical protein [Methylovulum sp.]MDD5125025.1 hypothetical protein [Methylovulum sp.]